ncbi:MAG: RNA polymerase factor sigma-54 [Alphaproteobacteria bacterium]
MALTPRLDLRQSQSLVMTPQLQQAIKLLQYNNVELAEFVETELERNPMLERDEGQADPARGETADQSTAFDSSERPDEFSGDSAELLKPDGMADGENAPLDADYGNQYESDIVGERPGGDAGDALGGAHWSGVRGGGSGFDDIDSNLEATLSEHVSLRDHLMEQMQMDISDPAERLIAVHLIDQLDESGWLSGDFATIADMLGCGTDDVERVLKKLQGMDPVGVFARDLKECLALQLADLNRLDPAMQTMLDNLEMLAAHDAKGLLKKCGVDEEDLRDMVAEIRSLNPKPAMAFNTETIEPVVPDILMRRAQDGGWTIELNSETLPRVLVNESYFARISKDVRKKPDNEYLTDQFQSANWLVKSLHQRATTIIKVAGEIVRQQNAFFDRGVAHLRPLVLRDIAEAIEMHESTVSRVTTNKYIHTPRGLFELKFFFTSAISGMGGDSSHSAESVRHRIRALIDAEPPKAILSDDQIVDMLKSEGIDIARRTVAKYREAMKIPSSVQRRRQKQHAI